VKNAEVARVFREIAAHLDMDGVAFKPRAYEKAADSLEALGLPVEEVHARGGARALGEIPGIGKSFAAKIAELLETGKIALHEELRAKRPVDVTDLLRIEGLGPKGVKHLHEALGVRTLADLEAAAKAGKVRDVPGFGAKAEEKLLRSIGFVAGSGRRLAIGRALPLARAIEARLRAVRGVREVVIAGSLRRRRETIGDFDFLAVADDPARLMKEFVAMPDAVTVHGHGGTKSSVRLAIGVDADLRVVPRESFGAALQYFTGSKDHGVACRKIAIEKGLKLNEYGVFRGESRIAGETEDEVYAALGLPWIPPELREDRGEIAAALERRLPKLVEYGSLRGDLQTQTDWTDGADSLEAMVRAAKAAGLEYVAITDHTRDLAMTRGSDEAKLRRQGEAIDALRTSIDGIRILKGAEVNIRRDGTLDVADEALAELDLVGVALHSHFALSRAEQTERVCRAIRNPHADVFFHPTARLIGKREAADFDVDEVIRVARETGTALEIDAFPDRLDLHEEHARRAIEAGVPLVIDSDAHATAQFAVLEYGIAVARRAGAEAKHVLNTLPCDRFLRALKGGRKPRKRR
jgi:DNA polymerase (family X)